MDSSKFLVLMLLVLLIGIAACDKDDDQDSTAGLSLTFSGLEDLGPDFVYEGWIIVNNAPQTTGIFSVDAQGDPNQTNFEIDRESLEAANTFVLTIEPAQDPDPGPSNVHLLGGDFISGVASLHVDHPTALGEDFQTSEGIYILATPTDDMDNNENSGIWFLNPDEGPGVGLQLPVLPDGWIYEGWAVIDGTPVTTGKFTEAAGSDRSAPYSGPSSGPPFPGEDFLFNAPSGLVFPTDLSGGKAVISIEPVPDNHPGPFLLKPLATDIPGDAIDRTAYDLSLNLSSLPTGTATK